MYTYRKICIFHECVPYLAKSTNNVHFQTSHIFCLVTFWSHRATYKSHDIFHNILFYHYSFIKDQSRTKRYANRAQIVLMKFAMY